MVIDYFAAAYVLRGDVIAVRCAPEGFKSPDDDVRSVSIEWFDDNHRSIAKRKQSRITVDDKLNLAVSGTQPEDVGHYTCVMTVILGSAKTIQLLHLVHLNGKYHVTISNCVDGVVQRATVVGGVD